MLSWFYEVVGEHVINWVRFTGPCTPRMFALYINDTVLKALIKVWLHNIGQILEKVIIECSKRIALYITEPSTYSKDSQNIQALLFEDMQKFGSSCFGHILTEKVPILYELDTLDT